MSDAKRLKQPAPRRRGGAAGNQRCEGQVDTVESRVESELPGKAQACGSRDWSGGLGGA